MKGPARLTPGLRGVPWSCTPCLCSNCARRDAQRVADTRERSRLLPSDDLGVDLMEHSHRVTSPLRDLRRRHTGRQPRRHTRMPQVVRPPRASTELYSASDNADLRARSHTRAIVDSARSPPVKLRNRRPSAAVPLPVQVLV